MTDGVTSADERMTREQRIDEVRSTRLEASHAEEVLKAGDKTILRPGMTFAVDGGISVDGVCGGRIGDSIVVTEDGCDYLTDYRRELLVV